MDTDVALAGFDHCTIAFMYNMSNSNGSEMGTKAAITAYTGLPG